MGKHFVALEIDVVDEKSDFEGEDEAEQERPKLDLGKLSSKKVKMMPIWQNPAEKWDLDGALSATKFAKKLMPNLGEHVKHLQEFERISDLHLRATDRINELSAAAQMHDQLEQIRKQPGHIPFDPPQVLSLNAHRDRRKEEHQEEIIAVLKAQNEKSAALIELNESAYKHAINSSKSNTLLTWCSILISAAVLIFTVYTYFFPPQSSIAAGLPMVESGESHETVAEVENSEAKEVTSDQRVSEEPAPPQPSPTAVRAPADSAESSSDQREP